MAEITDLVVVDNTARWPEGMRFRDVNDAGRSDESIIARWFQDTNGSLISSGSNNRTWHRHEPCASW
jgi:hypothetical protein